MRQITISVLKLIDIINLLCLQILMGYFLNLDEYSLS